MDYRSSFYYKLPARRDFKAFLSPDQLQGLNALTVAAGVFEIEHLVQERGLKSAILSIHKAEEFGYDLERLGHAIRELLLFVLVEDIEISFRKARLRKRRRPEQLPLVRPIPNVCLFSGGIDSYAGILLAKQKLQELEGVFCAHSDQSKIIHIVRKLQRRLTREAGIRVHKVRVPSIGLRGYAQLRGFLYIVASAAWMHLLQANKLLVTECGPTMYQPRFAPFDAVTMTTHPVVLRQAREVISIVLQREVEIITPFEDLTKAEVMAVCPKKKGLKYTHSCVSQRFGHHDGTCYGCVIRRLGAIAAGIEDVRYAKNPIVDEDAAGGNLISLLAFCHDVLTGYSEMDDYEIENIEAYKKHDLFKRFALDNFAAIHRLASRGSRLRPSVRKMYESLCASLGVRALETRLGELRRARFTPAF